MTDGSYPVSPHAHRDDSVAPPGFGSHSSVDALPTNPAPGQPVRLSDGPPPVMLSASEPEWELAPPLAPSAPGGHALAESAIGEAPHTEDGPVHIEVVGPLEAVTKLAPAEEHVAALAFADVQVPQPVAPVAAMPTPPVAAEVQELAPAPVVPVAPVAAPAAPEVVAPVAVPAAPGVVHQPPAAVAEANLAPNVPAPAAPAPVVEAVQIPVQPVQAVPAPAAPAAQPEAPAEPDYPILEGVRHPRQIIEQLARAEAAAAAMQAQLAEANSTAAA